MQGHLKINIDLFSVLCPPQLHKLIIGIRKDSGGGGEGGLFTEMMHRPDKHISDWLLVLPYKLGVVSSES
jgi:hypothetical protein